MRIPLGHCAVVFSVSADAVDYVMTPKSGINSTAIFDDVAGMKCAAQEHGPVKGLRVTDD